MTSQSSPDDRYISANGVTLHYLDWGSDRPSLLFLPGILGTAYAFISIGNRMAQHFRVLALTRRGNGRSDKPKHGYDIHTLVADIVAFLDELSIKSTHVAGFSFAGAELTSLASDHPSRVRTAVYLDAAYDFTLAPGIFDADPLNSFQEKLQDRDLESFEAYASYIRRSMPDLDRLWSEDLAREIFETIEVLPDGRIRRRMPDDILNQLWETIDSYSPDYSRVKAPALAIYSTCSEYRAKPRGLSQDLINRADKYWREVRAPADRLSMDQFRKSAVNGRALELQDTYHACFIHKEDEVFQAMLEFLASA